MDCHGLLEEAKYFMHFENVRRYIEEYFAYIEDEQAFETYLSSIEDIAIGIML